MTWLGIDGHDSIVDDFRNCLRRGRLASTYLFVGTAGVGKRTFALRLAQSLLCPVFADEQLNACGTCPACQQVRAGTHPDLEVLGLPEGKSSIPLELLIGGTNRRMREGICHWLSLKPGPGSRKIAIIDDADFLNLEGANCLLKTLEEPPPRSLIILVGTSQQRQLPTIRSRAQVIRFRRLSHDVIRRLLVDEICAPGDDVKELVDLADGSLAHAKELAQPGVWEFRAALLETLSQPGWDRLALTRQLTEFVDAAGKEAPVRRVRMRLVADMIARFYHELLRNLCAVPCHGDGTLGRTVHVTTGWWPGDEESVIAVVRRCLQARSEIDANANQATLLASWMDDLGEAAVGQPIPD